MAIVLSQTSVRKDLNLFDDRAIDAVAKECVQLDEKGILIPVELRNLTQDEKTRPSQQ